MSQPIRRMLAAMSLALTFLLAVPGPSRAATVQKPAAGHSLGLAAQVWSWLESLLGSSQPGVLRKDATTGTGIPLPPPPPPSQGPMIDPDGREVIFFPGWGSFPPRMR